MLASIMQGAGQWPKATNRWATRRSRRT
jgi:hypothetical protein